MEKTRKRIKILTCQKSAYDEAIDKIKILNKIINSNIHHEKIGDSLLIEFEVKTKKGNMSATEEQHFDWAYDLAGFCDLDVAKAYVELAKPKKENQILHDDFFNKIPYAMIINKYYLEKVGVDGIEDNANEYYRDEVTYFKTVYGNYWRKRYMKDAFCPQGKREYFLNQFEDMKRYKYHDDSECNEMCKKYRAHPGKELEESEKKFNFDEEIKTIEALDKIYIWNYTIRGDEYVLKFSEKEITKIGIIKERIVAQCESYLNIKDEKIREMIEDGILEGRNNDNVKRDLSYSCDSLDYALYIIEGISDFNLSTNKEHFPERSYFDPTTKKYHFSTHLAKKIIFTVYAREMKNTIELEILLEKMEANKISDNEWTISEEKIKEIRGGE